MKTVFFLILTTIIISCSKNPVSKTDELLTSVHWKPESRPPSLNEENSETKEVYQFFKDGRYVLYAHDTRINGKWSWTSSNEIYVKEVEIIISGKAYKFDSSNNRYIKVIEISDKVLRTLERHEEDGWDSGFAKEIIYIPEV